MYINGQGMYTTTTVYRGKILQVIHRAPDRTGDLSAFSVLIGRSSNGAGGKPQKTQLETQIDGWMDGFTLGYTEGDGGVACYQSQTVPSTARFPSAPDAYRIQRHEVGRLCAPARTQKPHLPPPSIPQFIPMPLFTRYNYFSSSPNSSTLLLPRPLDAERIVDRSRSSHHRWGAVVGRLTVAEGG